MRRIRSYIHQDPDWPKFYWDHAALAGKLAGVRHRQGRLIGRMEALGFSLRKEALLQTLTQDVLKSSEIEGEVLNSAQVRSSIARRLGMDVAGLVSSDRNVEGVVELMLDATQNYDKPLTKERLFGWHVGLFPASYSGIRKMKVGAWRDDAGGPMQVVSGPIGHERVHYEAPSADRLEVEMTSFIDWANQSNQTDPVLRAAVAHLWFVTIHPFDDGNGRMARAIADWALARSEKSPQRFYSMSSQIRAERKAYYDILEMSQKDSLDITRWLEWFLDCLGRAFDHTESTLSFVLRNARFWEDHSNISLNDRQRLILNKMLDGFEGKLTSSKWAKIAKCSQDTAHRDILNLMEQGILIQDSAGGRSTSYSLSLPAPLAPC